jgi:hypothetical protein
LSEILTQVSTASCDILTQAGIALFGIDAGRYHLCDILTEVGTALSDILTEVHIALYVLDTGKYRTV